MTFTVIAPQANFGIDWQGFQFQTPQSCQHPFSSASCLPHFLTHFCFPNHCSYTSLGGEHVLKFFWSRLSGSCLFLKSPSKKIKRQKKKLSPVSRLNSTSFSQIHGTYRDPRYTAITHECHNPVQIANMSAEHDTAWHGLLIFFITATADSNDYSRERQGLIYDERILLHRLCLQRVFTLQVLLLDLHQRVHHWNGSGEDASEADSASI